MQELRHGFSASTPTTSSSYLFSTKLAEPQNFLLIYGLAYDVLLCAAQTTNELKGPSDAVITAVFP
jgi:hypothetical protein